MMRIDQGQPAPSAGRILQDPIGEILAAELAALTRMDGEALRTEWRRLYRRQSPPKLSRDLLELVVAWKLQELVLGGLGSGAERQLAELAEMLTSRSDLPRVRRVSLKPGARIVRHWGGQSHEVAVAENGFLWRGRIWKSLSAIARELTGTRWSGPRFFGLDKGGAPRRRAVRPRMAGDA
jgi:hypothetical protein